MAKPVIISSQFLESMIHAPMPLRAEMTDIHSAVMDGADGLMLVSETSIGKFPVEAIRVVNDVCIAAEQHFRYQEHFTEMLSNADKPLNKLEAMANSSVKSAFNL
jgi:pyruvate kinase